MRKKKKELLENQAFIESIIKCDNIEALLEGKNLREVSESKFLVK
jgi:hypothetical protein